eukprot:3980132-Prymnesium_polylepis.1
MAVMAGDSERRAAATEDRLQQAPSSVSPGRSPRCKTGPMRSAKCADKMAPAGKLNFFFQWSSRFFLERIIFRNGSNGSDTNCGILP